MYASSHFTKNDYPTANDVDLIVKISLKSVSFFAVLIPCLVYMALIYNTVTT